MMGLLRIPSIARVEQQLATPPAACTALPLSTCAGVDLHVPVSMDPQPTLQRVDAVKSLAPEREDSIAMLMEISARLTSFLFVLPKTVLQIAPLIAGVHMSSAQRIVVRFAFLNSAQVLVEKIILERLDFRC